ncbi:short-chain dehydrogenase [Halobellus salinus]|uniref:Short-chain dehydrogenase n=1 Tax=Halobellus salinus TaxID=931585 RepID=A0A830EPS3_9EURY|nr:SDR family oxidoreductase [Halobellus salinus]GGI98192.1 short-chain dehydrogenase [Halobellus salinus]SMP06481.1 NAD(P)-dependent dehydrogenase, short-chain alcohol dehydrogenase family [Halobellus salinus]
MELTDATVLVTGTSRGIGRALLAAFAAEGATVVGCARDEAALETAVTEATTNVDTDGHVEGVVADVQSEQAVADLVDTAIGAGDSDAIDVVVANAGVNHGAPGEMPIGSEPYDRFDDTLATNLRGVFAVAKEAHAAMPESGRLLVPSGSIANEPTEGMGAYAVSKAAVEGLVRQFSVDVAQAATIVDPGMVASDLSGPGGRDPEDIAPMFVWAAAEADAEEIDGERVDLRTWKRATRSR